jgi:acetyltransferase-like isoleucine patch superfamily enzyme
LDRVGPAVSVRRRSAGRVLPASFAERMRAVRRSRGSARATARDLTPPSPEAFGAFGKGSWIMPPSRVTSPELIRIGAGVRIYEHAWLSVVPAVEGVRPSLVIGNRCSIGRMVHIACVGEIVIEDDVLTSDCVFIADTYHGYSDPDRPVLTQPMAEPRRVVVGHGSFLGIGAIILQGVVVGAQAYVAAGAVVTRDVAPRTLVAGNPARAVRHYDSGSGVWIDAEA